MHQERNQACKTHQHAGLVHNCTSCGTCTHFFCAFSSAIRPETLLAATEAALTTFSLVARTEEGLARGQGAPAARLELARACILAEQRGCQQHETYCTPSKYRESFAELYLKPSTIVCFGCFSVRAQRSPFSSQQLIFTFRTGRHTAKMPPKFDPNEVGEGITRPSVSAHS